MTEPACSHLEQREADCCYEQQLSALHRYAADTQYKPFLSPLHSEKVGNYIKRRTQSNVSLTVCLGDKYAVCCAL